MTSDKQLYRVREAMAVLSLSRSVIYELIRSGRLRSSHRRPLPADPRVCYRRVRQAPGKRGEGRVMAARRSRGDGGLSWDKTRQRWAAFGKTTT
jgi:hypothetical protein